MFNKENFSDILNKINKEYPNMTEFAKVANFDRTYISKYIHQRLDNPPTPKILMGISNASKGITTYAELLNICGYLPFELNDSVSSLDNKLSETIFKDSLYKLNEYELLENDLAYLTELLVNRKEDNSIIESKLNDFALKYPESKTLYTVLIEINDNINNALVNLNKNGYLYPIPIYKNNKHIDLFLTTDIVDYTNYNVPVDMSFNDFFALLIDTDKMFPLLDVNDIAIIQKSEELENGQIIAVYSTTKECCLIGKLFRYENIIELSYLNSKSEKFIVNDIKFLGKVIKSENQSAFK